MIFYKIPVFELSQSNEFTTDRNKSGTHTHGRGNIFVPLLSSKESSPPAPPNHTHRRNRIKATEFHQNKENGVRADNDKLGAAGKPIEMGRQSRQHLKKWWHGSEGGEVKEVSTLPPENPRQAKTSLCWSGRRGGARNRTGCKSVPSVAQTPSLAWQSHGTPLLQMETLRKWNPNLLMVGTSLMLPQVNQGGEAPNLCRTTFFIIKIQ